MVGPLHSVGIWSVPLLLGGLIGSTMTTSAEDERGKHPLPFVLAGLLVGAGVLVAVVMDTFIHLDVDRIMRSGGGGGSSGAVIIIDQAFVSQLPYINLLFTIAISGVLATADAGRWYGPLRALFMAIALLNVAYLIGKAFFELGLY